MINIKDKKILKQILSVLIICVLAFTPVGICGQLQDYIQEQGNQFQEFQSNSCCCDKEAQCPTDSETDDNCPDDKCRCACYDNIPRILASFDIQPILMQNSYYLSEFQIKPLQPNQKIFHPPKQ